MRRPLGGFESAEAWTGESFAYNAVAVVRLSGGLSAERLAAALAEVQRRHPLLRVRLERRGGRWFFATAAGAVPLRRVERDGDERWRAVVEEELDRRLETDCAPLARCCLVALAGDDGACELVLVLHHAIADAASAATICRELLTLCGGGSLAPVEERAALPPAPDTLFPPRFHGLARYPALAAFLARRLAEEVAYLWRSRGARSAAPAGPAHCRILPVALGEAATRALVRGCRRHRVPLNSALNAALLLAVQEHRYGGRALPLRYFAFADLRPYLEPPPPPETVASYLTTMRFTLGVGRGEGFWQLAGRIGRQLLVSFRRGEKFLFCMTAAPLLRAIIRLRRMRFGSAAVSYTGPLSFPERFGGLEVRGFNAFVSNMPIGAEVTGLARLYRGRLWWDFVTLDADMDEAAARAIAADILRCLEEAADEPD
jgi:hypothetical protein